jgi:hypothetical protein
MELLNTTNMLAGYTMGMKPSGREMLVVAVKGTFNIPRNLDEQPELADQQIPLAEADTFTGDPGFSAPLHEVDYAPIKHRCDVLFNGSAYAPNGKPTSKVQVGIKLGHVAKSFNVLGNRYWEAGATGIGPGYPAVFAHMPISYDNAYGGVDNFLKDKKKHSAYMPNPAGKGYHRELANYLVDGTPMPNTEELNRPIKTPYGNYRPMAFGPLGRGWQERLKYAGTYDDNWLENIFPFLPADFDERYYQAAPANQQITYPQGGEEVTLVNLTPEGRCQFILPTIDVPVVFFKKNGEKHETKANIDTIVLEPDLSIFSLTWRAQIELRKNIFEIPQVLVGEASRAWWRARKLGKNYYPSLAHLSRAKKAEAEEAEA